MDSVPNAASPSTAIDPAQVPAGGSGSSDASGVGVRFNLSPGSEGAPQRKQKRVARSSTPEMRGSQTPPSRARSAPPKRSRGPASDATDPQPDYVDPGSPWSNVAADVPGNGASADDVRFWAYKRFGIHFESLSKLCVNSNHLLDENKRLKKEMKERPTYDEVKAYLNERLSDYVMKSDLNAEITVQVQDRPTFDQTAVFVRESVAAGYAAMETNMNLLTSQVQAAIIQIDEAMKGADRAVKWIENVETNFHQHVG